jgi:hypothetical protein
VASSAATAIRTPLPGNKVLQKRRTGTPTSTRHAPQYIRPCRAQ